MTDRSIDGFERLVKSYLADADTAWRDVKARAGVGSLDEWSKSGLSDRGKLPGDPDISFFFHSERPELKLSYGGQRKVIDMIFYRSELGVFDFHRLHLYVTEFTDGFPEFGDQDVLQDAIVESSRIGLIEATEWAGVYRLRRGFFRAIANFFTRI